MKNKQLSQSISAPEGVTITLDGDLVTVAGPKGQVFRRFIWPGVTITLAGKALQLATKNASQREIKMLRTFAAHFRNLLAGVTEGHNYKLKICSGHFPMTAAVNNNEFTVKNFLGEKVPRTCKIIEGANVKVDGDIVTVEGSDIEVVGQTAANIEQLTRITNRDLRIFQDGIYLINKAGRELN